MIQEQWQRYLEAAPDEDDSARAGLAWVPWLAAVRFQGSNARDFLQGYLTCDTARLHPGRLAPTALCSLKGRVVMNGWCAPENDEDVLLVLHESLVDVLMDFLKPYLMFSRNTSLTDLRSDVLLLASLDLTEEERGLDLDPRRRLFPLDTLGAARALWETHPHVSPQTWLAELTADGIPLVSLPVSDAFLPQMLDLDVLGAIDFEKGCYLGQEVVARAQHRGQVKRRLARLTWEGPAAPEPGQTVTDSDGKAHGVVLQSAPAAADSGYLLAVLSRQAPERLQQGDARLEGIS